MAFANENYYVDLTASPVRHPAAPAAVPTDIAAERLARKRARDREYQRVRRANARAARAAARARADADAEMEDFENYIDAAIAAAAAAAAAAIEAEGVLMRARPIDEVCWPVYEKALEDHVCEDEDDERPGSRATECAICLGGGKKWASLACGHVFCDACVRKSLMFKPKCPTCRAPARLSDVRPLFI
jgi:hypothetical protein